jgi:NTE family protein
VLKHIFINTILVLLYLPCLALSGEKLYEREQPSIQSIIIDKKHVSDNHRFKVGLVLSGGGARGLTQIGVLKGLEKYDIPIDLIVGTSMGSVVGGFYAAGYSSQELEKIVKKIAWDDLFTDETEREDLFLPQKVDKDRYFLKLRFNNWSPSWPTSITPGQKILSTISDQLYNASFQAVTNFDYLKIPFRAVATDLVSGQRIVIADGDLAEAIYASTAVPLLFSPLSWKEEQLLVDGGLRSNFAVDVAKSLGIDKVIVVDNTSPLRNQDKLKAPWEIADQVTTIMQQSKNEEQIKLADIVIRPDLQNLSSTDFDQIDRMITIGEAAVDQLANQLQYLAVKDHSNPDTNTYYILNFDENSADVLKDDKVCAILNADDHMYITLKEIREDIDHIFAPGLFSKVTASLKDSVLIYSVLENPKYNSMIFKGNHIYPDSILLAQISHPDSSVLNYNIFSKDLQAIREYYRHRGYVLMHYTDIQFDEQRGQARVHINEGIIDTIKIEGNDHTADFVIRREFLIKERGVFNANLIRRGIENIHATQLFERVNANLKIRNGSYNLILKVEEKKFPVLRLGGKIGTERGAQGYLELSNENFLGIGSKLSLLGRAGERDRLILLNFRWDRVFESYLTIAMQGYYNRQINLNSVQNKRVGEYKESRLGVRLVVGQQLRKLGQMTVELRVENVKDTIYTGQFSDFQNSELRTLAIRSVTDKRDRIAFTTKGIYNIWFWETGSERILEGQEKYTKALVNLEGFYTYWSDHTFHIKGGIAIGDKTLPFSEFFRIGGLNSFMGLHALEYVGRQIIYCNLEYRYKLPLKILSDIYVALRYDIGGVWKTPDLVLDSEDFFNGIGAWIGTDTILGPIIIGYGDTNINRGVFYFSLGYDF